MNIKSLLLGSAAALVAVSGARAADAVMAEPEAVEYVRVCDAYGAGYFYIPGTETCLRIWGYVRYDMGFGEFGGLDVDGDGLGDAWNKRARASFRVSTKSDTEFGTLATFIETRWQWDNNSASFSDNNFDGDLLDAVDFNPAGPANEFSLNFAYIELGGLRIGKDESVFTTWTGYAGNNVDFDGASVGYGPFDVTLISYTFDAGNGFSAILSLEDDNGAGEGYMPNVAGGAKYTSGGWTVAAVLGYDEAASEWAGKLRVDATMGAFSAFIMGGYGSSPVNGSFYQPWVGDWALWGGIDFVASEKINLGVTAEYDDGQNFGAAAHVNYTIVPGFVASVEVAYDNDGATNADQFGGIIRFQRSY